MILQHSFLTLSKHSARLLVFCLIVLQAGFISAEPLWMAAAEVEHHHLLEDFEPAAQFQASSHHQDEAHHCDVCHGHGAHLAVVAVVTSTDSIQTSIQASALPELTYQQQSFNSIYRPPITYSA